MVITRASCGLLLLACAAITPLFAQNHTSAPVTAALPSPPAPPQTSSPADTLVDALTCRSENNAMPGLLARLRRERPRDFVQTDRQYSEPAMDLYRLEDPVHAWGQSSDAVVITANRVLMVVRGPIEIATQRLDDLLAATTSEPLAGAFDDQHALVVYEEQRPGLQERVLIGCEYRLPELSLIDDPEDAWRRPGASATTAIAAPSAASASP